MTGFHEIWYGFLENMSRNGRIFLKFGMNLSKICREMDGFSWNFIWISRKYVDKNSSFWSALFWDITQRLVGIPYGRFGTSSRVKNILRGVSLKSRTFTWNYNLTKIADTLYEDLSKCMIISRWIILIMRNILDKSCRENQNAHLMFINFLPKIALFMR